MIKDIVDIKRCIDDGVEVHIMTERLFRGWKKEVSKQVAAASFHMKIKESNWSVPARPFDTVNFLDINKAF